MSSNQVTEFEALVSKLFEEYIINEMPTYLLQMHPDTGPIQTIELVGRFSLRPYYEKAISEIREDDIVLEVDEEWEDAILKVIKEKVQYATLSHRWVDGDSETSFQYMQCKPKVDRHVGGFEKLYEFCQKARNDFDCSFVWCDMCCIDKTNSSE